MNSSPSSSSPISVCLAICVRGVWTNTCPTVTAPLGSDDGGRLVLSVEESTRASLLCAQQRDFWRWWLLPCSRCGARMLHTRKQRLHEMHVKAIYVISPILQISEAPVGGSVWSGCKDAKGGSGGISVTCDTFVWEISANQTSSWGLRVCVFIRLHSGLMGAASASITCNHGLRWRGGGLVLCSQCMTSIKFLLTSCSIHTTTLLSGEQRSELHTNKVHTDLCLCLAFSASGANWAPGALPTALLLCFISLSLFLLYWVL